MRHGMSASRTVSRRPLRAARAQVTPYQSAAMATETRSHRRSKPPTIRPAVPAHSQTPASDALTALNVRGDSRRRDIGWIVGVDLTPPARRGASLLAIAEIGGSG